MNGRARGILCLVTSAFGFSLMAFFVRWCDDFGGELSCFEKGFFRNLVALFVASVVFARQLRTDGGVTVPSGAGWFWLLLRCLFGSFGIFANFYAISHIQVSEAMALNKTAPFFTVLASWLLLGERPRLRQLAALAVAFAGALMVVRPGWRLAGETPVALLGLASGLGAGVAYACVHKLGRMQISGALIVLCFSAVSCLLAVPFMLFDFRPMNCMQLLILLGAGAGAAIGQFGITAAYRLAEPRSIAAYDYIGVVFAAIFGLAFFAQVPDVWSTVGFLLIILGAFRLQV